MSDDARFAPAARWIWDDGEPSPRNAWRCFRRTVTIDDDEPDARLRVTADTRYVAYVNGVRVGHGPVRGFPEHWFVDDWEVGHLLRPGANVVAVLVRHDGVATFSSLRARGGLLAQLDLPASSTHVVSDPSWQVATHAGFDARSPRICPQLAFVEVVDGAWQPTWTTDVAEPATDDGWAPATVVGEPGQGPWSRLVARDVPALAEELVRPVRVGSLAFVRAAPTSWTLDARALFDPSSEHHANPSSYVGFLLTAIRVHRPARVRIALPLATSNGRVSGVALDGAWTPVSDLAAGHADLRTLDVDLASGDHWLALDVSAYDHGYPVPVMLEALDGADVALVHPTQGDAATPWVALGPVGAPDPAFERPLAHPALERMTPTPETRGAVVEATAARELGAWPHAARTVPAELAFPASLYGVVVHPSERDAVVVPSAVQALAGGGSAAVPHRPGRDTELVLDLGVEASGFVELELTAPPGVVVDVYGFEYLRDGYREETTGMENALRYTTRTGRQRHVSPVRRGLRYLQLVVRRPDDAAGPVVLHDVAVRSAHYPMPRTGEFSCSDTRLDAIWEMSRRTVVACAEDTFVDCPAYEQAYWVGDAYSSARFASALADVGPLVERCLRLVPGSRGQTPLLGSQVPSGWTNVIPAWTFFWVLACEEHAVRSGDPGFARDLAPDVVAALDAFAEHLDERSLLAIDAWNLLDWAPMDQPNSGVVAHQNCLYVMALDGAARLADAVGLDVGERLRARASAVRAAIAEHLWSPEREAYLDAIHADGRRSDVVSVQTQLFALLAGVGDDSRLARLTSLVVDPPHDLVQIGSPWMSIFRYDALVAAGRADVALADLRRDYGGMLDAGAVTCWEMFPAPDRASLTRSHCHAWSAAPAAFLPNVVLGVRLDGPRRVVVDPQPLGLDWARGAIPLPGGGRVEVAWERRADGTLDVRVDAPDGVEVGR
ncbi:alpha-L-rhamnosidase [Beutenbergia cavernae DSM 12333]|uniref:Alpha-L-rhamnosidase n=1 Tax=Beutenbergia cavernae (strain ATCC BAA-8 / DSM 12333 / CCUG 43141 / JCM 11478 / NBRC 16432 / NCIMB 13614 / HKI 0122) TaxID=471853 RepID=C5C3L4_BEUC1|nr:family 78 glycoside hydrolase catalytic domain [Beutenbergia cavernae]ACQ81923.1 alpha-L-rhamnosidase [Beutenbergia cavernae DSM 12333]